MRILKRIITFVFILGVVFVVGGMLLPRNVNVARSIEIDAPPEVVFPHVNSLKAAAEWSPWLGLDPSAQLTYEGPDEGVGAKLAWASEHPNVGNGSQEIVASEDNARVETALDFGQMGTATASYVLVEKDGGTEITWDLGMDMGMGPMGRWFGLMMDGQVGPDYETGLQNLKALVEG